MSPEVCELVGVGDEGLAVVLGDDVEDDAGGEQQQADDDEHDGADERGEAGHEPGLGELVGDAPHSRMPMAPMRRPMVPKKGRGLYSRIMRNMVLMTLIPSPTVSSLDTDPAGRSRYWMGIS